jgi:hypothetical protein
MVPIATTSTTTTTTSAPPAAASPEACVLVCGGATAVPYVQLWTPDYHAAAVANADQVFASMQDDLLACYKARVTQSPKAHASLTVDVILSPEGAVKAVETTGGALLGDRTMRCITDRVQRATFLPVRGSGTLRIQVPLTFALRTVDESI